MQVFVEMLIIFFVWIIYVNPYSWSNEEHLSFFYYE